MMDPERHEGTFGRDRQRHQAADHGRASRVDAASVTAYQAASPLSAPARIRRAGERLLLSAEAEGAVSEGGVPTA